VLTIIIIIMHDFRRSEATPTQSCHHDLGPNFWWAFVTSSFYRCTSASCQTAAFEVRWMSQETHRCRKLVG